MPTQKANLFPFHIAPLIYESNTKYYARQKLKPLTPPNMPSLKYGIQNGYDKPGEDR